jgi:hypothetical protein
MRVDIGARDEAQGLPIPEGLLIVAPHFSVGLASPGVSVPPGTIDQVEIGATYTTLKDNVLTIWNSQLNSDCGPHIFIEHHRTRTFQEEYLAFLKKHNLQFEEKYLWN